MRLWTKYLLGAALLTGTLAPAVKTAAAQEDTYKHHGIGTGRGALIGGAGGAAIGGVAGGGKGALIGGALGAGGGALVGHHNVTKHHREYRQRQYARRHRRHYR